MKNSQDKLESWRGIPVVRRKTTRHNPKKNWFIQLPRFSKYIPIKRFQKKVHLKGKDQVIIVTGPKGSGKSWLCLRIGLSINPWFDVKRDVVFSFDDLLALLNDPKIPGGLCIIWEEVGVGWGSREFMKGENIDIGKIMQTCRDKHTVLLMNVPVKSFVDKQGRLLAHGIINALKINEEKQTNILSYREISVNPYKGKEYNPYERIRENGGEASKVDTWELKKAPNDVILEYERARADFTEKQKEKAQKKRDERRKPKWKPPTIEAVAQEYNCSQYRARNIRAAMIKDHRTQEQANVL